MRKPVFAPLVLILGLAACAQQDTLSALTVMNDTIASTARVSRVALEQDRISAADACQISVYSKLAARAVDEGYLAYGLGDPEGAAGHVRAAKDIMAGVTAEAAAQVERECN